jgi:hypothetical protein
MRKTPGTNSKHHQLKLTLCTTEADCWWVLKANTAKCSFFSSAFDAKRGTMRVLKRITSPLPFFFHALRVIGRSMVNNDTSRPICMQRHSPTSKRLSLWIQDECALSQGYSCRRAGSNVVHRRSSDPRSMCHQQPIVCNTSLIPRQRSQDVIYAHKSSIIWLKVRCNM